MEITEIAVVDLVGQICVDETSGKKLYDKINGALENKRPVVLNFKGTKYFASSFFNNSLSRLYSLHTVGFLNKNVKIENLCPLGSSVLRVCNENAKNFYGEKHNEIF